ncbi:phage portal protein [Companilactobacillus farciminis]|uniref:phage portal protein n=1 Tax=Companilactobacillus farciminis TaxID=1612 RepID=UPI00241CBD89|nr:phage portal protein [Companilactobacillus farciminis]
MSFFRSLDDNQPKDWLRDYLDEGILPSNNGYTGIGALKNSDVLTAISILASDISRFSIIQIKESDDSIVSDDTITYLLNKKVNAQMSARDWKFAMLVNAILTGNSYTRIIRDPQPYSKTSGKPVELEFFPPSQVTINYRDDPKDGRQYYYTFSPVDGRKQFDLLPDDVIHFKFFTNDGIVGRSPLLSLGDEMGLQQSGVNTLGKFFKNGMKGGILTLKGSKLSKDARRKARSEFEYAQSDSGNGPIVVDETMTYQPLEIDTSVLNLINSNNWSTNQIAKALRVPAYRLGINNPNQSVKQLNAGYIQFDMPFYTESIISEFQMKLLTDKERHKYRFEFDTRKETARDVTELTALEEHNVLTPNEVRSELGKKADKTNKQMDQYQSTLNTVELGFKQKYQENNKTQLKGGDSNGKDGTKSDTNGSQNS